MFWLAFFIGPRSRILVYFFYFFFYFLFLSLLSFTQNEKIRNMNEWIAITLIINVIIPSPIILAPKFTSSISSKVWVFLSLKFYPTRILGLAAKALKFSCGGQMFSINEKLQRRIQSPGKYLRCSFLWK